MISGETNNTFTPTANGDYNCEITDNSCSKTSNTVSFVISGIRYFNEINVSIFPNPTTGKVEFVSEEKIASIVVYDLKGLELLVFENTNTINISNIVNGIYMVKIISENNKFSIQKIIKK